MKDTKKRMEMFSFYDYSWLEKHLANMAKRGWMLEKIVPFVWTYRKIEPADVRFAVTYFPDASEFDPETPEGQMTYIDYCEEAGWKLCEKSAQMQVFYAEKADAVPIETDAAVQLETIHKAMWKSYLPSYLLLILLGLMSLFPAAGELITDPVEFLLGIYGFTGVTGILLLVLGLGELICYYSWRNRAKRVLERENILPHTTDTRGLQFTVLALLIVNIAWFLLTKTETIYLFSLGVSFVFIIGMTALTFLLKNALKQRKVKAKTNFVLTMISCAVMAMLMAGCMVWFVVGMHNTVIFTRAEIVPYNGYEVRVYHDELPLTVEDLTDVPTDTEYSRQLERDTSLFVTRVEGKQRHPVWVGGNPPDLEYTVTITSRRVLYDRVLGDALAVDNTVFDYTYEQTDDIFGCEVYRMNHGDHWGNKWVIAAADCVIVLSFDEDLTEEQLELVIGRLTEG